MGIRRLELAGALIAAISVARGAETKVQWLSPRDQTPFIGQVELALAILPPDAAVEAVEFSLDGMNVATLTSPPWRTSIDAGDELRPRTLEATVRMRGARAVRSVRRIEVPRGAEVVEVPSVSLALTVLDPSGRPIRDLQASEVQVIDPGGTVAIDGWESSHAPLAVAMVLDVSNSMSGEKLEAAREASTVFVRLLSQEDQAALVSFSDAPKVVLPMGARERLLDGHLDQLVASGGTSLYDAVIIAARQLDYAAPNSRRVILLLSDGRDEAVSGLEPGSLHTLQEAIREVHHHNAELFAIGFGRALDRDHDFEGRFTTAEILKQLSESSGGTYSPVERPARLQTAFRGVIDELRIQYGLSYRPPPPRIGETWREIRVTVARKGAVVRTRRGYFVR